MKVEQIKIDKKNKIPVYLFGTEPKSLLMAGVHGDEKTGVVILKKIIKQLQNSKKSYPIAIIPCVNMQAYIANSRINPKDKIDFNRIFPVIKIKSESYQVGKVIQDFAEKFTTVIDIHVFTGQHTLMCGVDLNISKGKTQKKIKDLMSRIGMEAICRIDHTSEPQKDGSLCGYLQHKKILAFGIELPPLEGLTKNNANMFICGPDVIKAATGHAATMDEIGSAATHAAISGNIHFVAEDDKYAIELVRQLLSYLPPNNLLDPPHRPTSSISLTQDVEMNRLIPADNKEPLNMLEIIMRLVDDNSFLEVQKDWARNIILGFARIEGIVVGIVANQPTVKAGTIDIDAADKASRFIRFCNVFNIPLLTLVDVPGFLPGVAQERGGIIRHGAKMLFAYGAATVPKITVILRKAYGGAYLAMCSRDMGADMVFAWPTAEIAVMGAEGAVKIIYRHEIEAAKDPNAREAELISEYHERFASPYHAASHALITDVIEPSRTRSAVALALRTTLSKRETRPPKKHGNIPL